MARSVISDLGVGTLLRLLAAIFLLLPVAIRAGPPVSLTQTSTLDSSGVYFVSYDGLVNVQAFQSSAIITHNGYQYAAWYNSARRATLARRQLPSGGWTTLQLPRTLSQTNSHNVISLGISPSDGRIHVALDCHSSTMYYFKSEANLATNPGGTSWVASRFGPQQTTLDGLNIGSQITYPQFILTTADVLQFVYRSGVSGNGAAQLAEYNGSGWSNVGQWSSASGSWTGPNGVTSSTRNLYIHGYTYSSSGRVHVTGTWRESGGVSCSGGGLTNHDTVYLYSDDRGRTWRNNAGTTLSKPVAVQSSLVVDPLPPNYGLMNQESQDTDSANQPHAVISYVPGRFTSCVTSYASQRASNAYSFHVYRSSNGTWTKREIPVQPRSTNRSQIVLDSSDNVFVIQPGLRIASASRSSGYTDWTQVYDGSSSLNVFGEITVDRKRLATENVVSVFFQERSSNGSTSPVRVADLRLG